LIQPLALFSIDFFALIVGKRCLFKAGVIVAALQHTAVLAQRTIAASRL
jgi:hypothetical protein